MAAVLDLDAYVEEVASEGHRLRLLVDGMRCVACAFAIETALNAEPEVDARINVTARRLDLNWRGAAERGNLLAAKVAALGYGVRPWRADNAVQADADEERTLFNAMAVAGFGSSNVMLMSFALWFSGAHSMGPATRDMLHWMSALVALPCIIYAGQPFFQSAWGVLRQGRTNMDVPISLAITLASVISLFETIEHGAHAYFDSAIMLLFILLIGRWLDRRARGRARGAAQDLLMLMNGTATVLEDDRLRTIPIEQIRAGMLLDVAVGARIGADGVVESGTTEIDSSLITGESLPRHVRAGESVYAGTLNLARPIKVRAARATSGSLISDIVRLMQQAEQRQSRYVRLADRIARFYTPVVHSLALATFLGWLLLGHRAWPDALIIATTVLIITCPCALGLAVPAVQVVASSALFRRGILLKSADALERLAEVDLVMFDKTGTLTRGAPQWLPDTEIDAATRVAASSLAAHSRHALARALHEALPVAPVAALVHEEPGLGLEATVAGERWRLGRGGWCDASIAEDDALDLWFRQGDRSPVRFRFSDQLRCDAVATVAELKRRGYALSMQSGDRRSVVRSVARAVGIDDMAAELLPRDKVAQIETVTAAGHKVLMVGDGLNDAPALATAHASMSPASGIDITQNAADLVFQGQGLSAVGHALRAAHQARALVRQNILMSILYNICALPLAIAGHVTPLFAAAAMSGSSLIVVGNALRAGRFGRRG